MFNTCLTGPTNSGFDSAGPTDYSFITATEGCRICYDRVVNAIPGNTDYLLICDQTRPVAPAVPNLTGYFGVMTFNYITTVGSPTVEGQLFSFAFARDLNTKYYQVFDSTLTAKSSGYVFPRDTLF